MAPQRYTSGFKHYADVTAIVNELRGVQARAVTVSILGGTAESIALWFKSIGHERWFYYYLTGLIAISLIIYVTMRDTKRHSAMGKHE